MATTPKPGAVLPPTVYSERNQKQKIEKKRKEVERKRNRNEMKWNWEEEAKRRDWYQHENWKGVEMIEISDVHNSIGSITACANQFEIWFQLNRWEWKQNMFEISL